MPYFDTVNGPAMGQRIPLLRDQYILGRNPECDIVLESNAVSRQHAKAVKTAMVRWSPKRTAEARWPSSVKVDWPSWRIS